MYILYNKVNNLKGYKITGYNIKMIDGVILIYLMVIQDWIYLCIICIVL